MRDGTTADLIILQPYLLTGASTAVFVDLYITITLLLVLRGLQTGFKQ